MSVITWFVWIPSFEMTYTHPVPKTCCQKKPENAILDIDGKGLCIDKHQRFSMRVNGRAVMLVAAYGRIPLGRSPWVSLVHLHSLRVENVIVGRNLVNAPVPINPVQTNNLLLWYRLRFCLSYYLYPVPAECLIGHSRISLNMYKLACMLILC